VSDRLWARLTWQAADPAALAVDLGRRLGLAPTPHRYLPDASVFDLGSAALEIVPWQREGPTDEPMTGGRLVFEGVPGGLARPRPGAEAPLVLRAVAWATVELDRAERELGEWLTGEPADPDDDRDEPLLGARARLRSTDGIPGDTLAFLEPVTEGWLARSLARDGEGPCGLFVWPTAGLDGWVAAARTRGVRLGTLVDGPFGASVLVLDGDVAGPHLILVADG
jgi:hypothetical protein